MNGTIKILGIAGSLRKDSYNKKLLKIASEISSNLFEIEMYENLGKLPLYDEDYIGADLIFVKELKDKIVKADAILIVTPEYNYSVPGVLKNGIDWASRPVNNNSWAGKPVAIMGGTTGGFGTVRCQAHLRDILFSLHSYVLNTELYISKVDEKFIKDELIDQNIKIKISKLLDDLIIWTRQLRGESE